MPELYVELLKSGHQVRISTDLTQSIGNVDIIYSTRIQEERFLLRLRQIYTVGNSA